MLSGDLESLLNDLGKGVLNESTIKGRLALIQEQAQAQEDDIAQKKADLEHAEKRITELEVQLHEHEQEDRGDRLKGLTEKVLQLFFDKDDDGFVTTQDLARALGIKKNLAQHYCDILYAAEMIQWAGVGTYYIAAKGSAHVVDHGLDK